MKNNRYLFLISIFVVGLMPMSLIDGETTPPIVNITSHTNNQDVSGTITITATATDSGSGIDFVQFYFGGELISIDSSSPYSSTSITVKNYKEGTQTILVFASDNDENFAIDSVNVNVVISNNDYDWSDSDTEGDSDSVTIWFHQYDMYFENIGVYGISDDLRKVEFDWYTNDDNSFVECYWTIYGYGDEFSPTYGLLNPPGTNPTHVTLIYGPDEFTTYEYPGYLYVTISMVRLGTEILHIYSELGPF